MNSTKRVINGDYNVYANNLRIHGNLDVIGTTTIIESTQLNINDKFITLNNGETGNGVTGNYAGFIVDRGLQPNVEIRWNELSSQWQLSSDGTTFYAISYGVTLVGSDTQVIYNSGGTGFGANSNFTYDPGSNTLTAGGASINSATISTVSTNGNLTLDPNGSGQLVVNAATGLAYQASAPGAVTNYNYLYANTPNSGGSGMYFVNNTTSDELISKKRAQFYALIM